MAPKPSALRADRRLFFRRDRQRRRLPRDVPPDGKARDESRALFASFGDFPLFAALSKLYFAAASFTEAARRLSPGAPLPAFLRADDPVFGPALRDCCGIVLRAAARGGLGPGEREELLQKITSAIEPLDIAGLCDASRRNWHPVLAGDLLASSRKLGVEIMEIEGFLEGSGFFAGSCAERR